MPSSFLNPLLAFIFGLLATGPLLSPFSFITQPADHDRDGSREPHSIFDTDDLGRYATDTQGVSYRGAPLPGADPASFRSVSPYYAKDAARVYYVAEPLSPSSSPRVLSGADPESLAPCPGDIDRDDCARDDAHVYLEGRLVPGADPRTFRMLDDDYGVDAQHVYFAPDDMSASVQVLEGADPASFELVRDAPYDARDAHATYRAGQPLPR